MLISRLQLQNWRNFKKIEVDLRDRVFVIGPNASGKSNLLDVFRFLRDVAKPKGGGLQRAVEMRGGMTKVRCLLARSNPEVLIEVDLAEKIDAHRKRVLGLAGTAGGDFASAARMSAPQSPPAPALPAAGTTASAALTLTGLYNVLAALRAGRALTAKEKAIHTQGLVGVLRELHDELDAAVLAAYGLPPHASPDAILAHLVQLNTQRAQQEAQGHIRWLRPSFQNPQKSLSKQELVPLENTALEADSIEQKPLSKEKQTQPWPATLPEQVGAVAALLSASPSALTLAEIEACFKGRGAWKKNLPTLLQTLAALGRAHPQEHPEGVAWRAIH